MMNVKNEMRVYEILGVKYFQKLVFSLERFIHRKDHGVNINYHISRNDASALDAFIKYLFYNGAIHTRNLVIFAVYILVKCFFQWRYGLYDVLICLFAIKDLYCVMLQRYNFLRIRRCKDFLSERRARRRDRLLEKYRNDFASSYDFAFAEFDLAVVKRLKSCIEKRECVVLSEEEILALNRLLSVNTQITESS